MANIDEFNDDAELEGFMADPNEVDPVSGNEIPLGATAEGVRDDQTAAISPGEFVIPDYAVRYHGLDFYVDSLQQAKQGLQQMEGMGLVGNPDEQTIPDEAPLPTMDNMNNQEGEMSDTGRPMAEMAAGEMLDTGQPSGQEFQTGGLATTTLPQTPQQQPIPTTPLPQPPVVQPIRPVSAQPVPAPVAPIAPLGLNTTQYQQGYYKEVSPGLYQQFAPPGISTTAGLVTLDKIPDPSLIAPKGTKYTDIFGPQPSFTKGTPQSQYLQFQGPAAGLPGGYKIEPYINEANNVIYLTTIGGQVQGGAPPGYTKASQEDLNVSRREAPVQYAAVRPRRQQPTSGDQPDASFGDDAYSGATEMASYDQVSDTSMQDAVDNMNAAFDEDQVDDVASMYGASFDAAGAKGLGTVGKGIAAALGPVASIGAGIATNISSADTQRGIAAAQVAGLDRLGMPNPFGIGNFSLGAVYGMKGVPDKVAGKVTVTSHPSLSVQQVQAYDAVQFGVNPFSKNYDPANFAIGAYGKAIGYNGSKTLGAYASGKGTAADYDGAYDMTTGSFVGPTGVAATGTKASYDAASRGTKAAVANARGYGGLFGLDANRSDRDAVAEDIESIQGISKRDNVPFSVAAKTFDFEIGPIAAEAKGQTAPTTTTTAPPSQQTAPASEQGTAPGSDYGGDYDSGLGFSGEGFDSADQDTEGGHQSGDTEVAKGGLVSKKVKQNKGSKGLASI